MLTIQMFPAISIAPEEIVSKNVFKNHPLRPSAAYVKAKHTFAPLSTSSGNVVDANDNNSGSSSGIFSSSGSSSGKTSLGLNLDLLGNQITTQNVQKLMKL